MGLAVTSRSSASSDITSGRVHQDVCWIDQFTSLPSGLKQMLRWTSPLVMSEDTDFQWLVTANHTYTWWYNISTLNTKNMAKRERSPCAQPFDSQVLQMCSQQQYIKSN